LLRLRVLTRGTKVTSGQNYLAVIKVVGIGGGGGKAISRMIDAGLKGVEFIALNTDFQDLMLVDANVKHDLGREVTKGLGAGANPEMGRLAAEADEAIIEDILRGADMVFITAGEGGGTGTGAAPVVARIARRLGALTVGVVTKPFSFENARRMQQAELGLEALRQEVDTLIVIPNERLLSLSDKSISFIEAFKAADTVLLNGVGGITEIITTPGLINLDFADVKSVMENAGGAFMGIGKARGENRAVLAAEAAIASPLLEESIEGARSVLISIAGASDIGLFEVNDAANLIKNAVHKDANVIWGMSVDEKLGDEVKVTVVAAGFDSGTPGYRPAPSISTNEEGAVKVAPEEESIPTWLNADAEAEPGVTASDAPAEQPATYTGPTRTIVFEDAELGEEIDVPDFLK
jgi:cell division protein FtsZ